MGHRVNDKHWETLSKCFAEPVTESSTRGNHSASRFEFDEHGVNKRYNTVRQEFEELQWQSKGTLEYLNRKMVIELKIHALKLDLKELDKEYKDGGFDVPKIKKFFKAYVNKLRTTQDDLEMQEVAHDWFKNDPTLNKAIAEIHELDLQRKEMQPEILKKNKENFISNIKDYYKERRAREEAAGMGWLDFERERIQKLMHLGSPIAPQLKAENDLEIKIRDERREHNLPVLPEHNEPAYPDEWLKANKEKSEAILAKTEERRWETQEEYLGKEMRRTDLNFLRNGARSQLAVSVAPTKETLSTDLLPVMEFHHLAQKEKVMAPHLPFKEVIENVEDIEGYDKFSIETQTLPSTSFATYRKKQDYERYEKYCEQKRIEAERNGHEYEQPSVRQFLEYFEKSLMDECAQKAQMAKDAEKSSDPNIKSKVKEYWQSASYWWYTNHIKFERVKMHLTERKFKDGYEYFDYLLSIWDPEAHIMRDAWIVEQRRIGLESMAKYAKEEIEKYEAKFLDEKKVLNASEIREYFEAKAQYERTKNPYWLRWTKSSKTSFEQLRETFMRDRYDMSKFDKDRFMDTPYMIKHIENVPYGKELPKFEIPEGCEEAVYREAIEDLKIEQEEAKKAIMDERTPEQIAKVSQERWMDEFDRLIAGGAEVIHEKMLKTEEDLKDSMVQWNPDSKEGIQLQKLKEADEEDLLTAEEKIQKQRLLNEVKAKKMMEEAQRQTLEEDAKKLEETRKLKEDPEILRKLEEGILIEYEGSIMTPTQVQKAKKQSAERKKFLEWLHDPNFKMRRAEEFQPVEWCEERSDMRTNYRFNKLYDVQKSLGRVPDPFQGRGDPTVVMYCKDEIPFSEAWRFKQDDLEAEDFEMSVERAANVRNVLRNVAQLGHEVLMGKDISQSETKLIGGQKF